MKRVIIFTLICILLFTGCGLSDDRETASEKTTEESKTASTVSEPGSPETTGYTTVTESIPATEASTSAEASSPETDATINTDRSTSSVITTKTTTGGEDQPQKVNERFEAVYLGVRDYGKPGTDREHMDNFEYVFDIDGARSVYRIDNGEPDENGKYAYPVQNILKRGYGYLITVEDGVVTDASEIKTEDTQPEYIPPVAGVPGKLTVENFLKTALSPVGTTLYIYGGGWDWQDEREAIQTRTFGVSPDWIRFFRSQNEDYTYRDKDGDENNKDPENSYYPYGRYNEYYYAGLDCAGYVSWVLNNTFGISDHENSMFSGATGTAKMLSGMGLGELSKSEDPASVLKPGDIVSISGHVWICLGVCDDNSVVILHSTPSISRSGQPGGGVQISAIGDNEDCEAYKLADRYMSEYYAGWYERYPAVTRSPDIYFDFTHEKAGVFTWNVDTLSGLSDPSGIRDKSAADVLKTLFGE